MLSCKEVTRLLSEAQERELTWRERSELKVHRMICKACNNFGKQMVSMRSIARQYAKNKNIDAYLKRTEDTSAGSSDDHSSDK